MKASTRASCTCANGATIASNTAITTMTPKAMLRSRVLIGVAAIVIWTSRPARAGTWTAVCVTPGPLRYTELIILLQGIFWLRSLIQIKLGLMAFFGVYAIGMMTLRNTSDCQPMSPMGQKRTFVFQLEPISDVDTT